MVDKTKLLVLCGNVTIQVLSNLCLFQDRIFFASLKHWK